jgi:hypothetical protein
MDGTNVKPKIVNFFGGARSGKSGCAAGLFSYMRLIHELRDVCYVDTKFGIGNISFDSDKINILEHHFPDIDRLRALLEHNDCLNIFLLRTRLNSDVTEAAIKLDSKILDMLYNLKVEVHVKPYAHTIPVEVYTILESKQWITTESGEQLRSQ